LLVVTKQPLGFVLNDLRVEEGHGAALLDR